MSDTSLPPGPVRAAVVCAGEAFPEAIGGDPYPDRLPGAAPARTCAMCGVTLKGRQTSACSDKCRAAKSRRTRVPIPVDKYRDILASLTAAKATLEKYGLQDLARTRSR